LKTSFAYHPHSDGQTEVVNHCLEQYLRCLCSQHPRQWENCLSWAEFWYNSSFHSTLGTTPFQALYGRPPPTVVNYLVGSLVIDEVDQALLSRDELLLQLKNNLQQASNWRTRSVAIVSMRSMIGSFSGSNPIARAPSFAMLTRNLLAIFLGLIKFWNT